MAWNAIQNLGGRVSEAASGSEGGDRDMLTETSFDQWKGSNLTAGDFHEIATFQVPAQEAYVWGYGEPAPGKELNQGRIYFEGLDGSSNSVVGHLRLGDRKRTGKQPEDRGTFHSSELGGDVTDLTTWTKLPERDMPQISQDSILYLEFKYDSEASAGSTLDQSATTFRANVTAWG